MKRQRRRMRFRASAPLLCVLAIALTGSIAVLAQQQTSVTVLRTTNLRSDPSTYYDPVASLAPGTRLTLLNRTPVEHYYKVRTPGGEEGWVYEPNVRIATARGVGPFGARLGAVPDLPTCEDDSDDHSRFEMKTRGAAGGAAHPITVAAMLNWRVPTNLDSSARKANTPIAPLENAAEPYALTGYVRAVKFEADCDFHVQVASSKAENAPQVIVEIPRTNDNAQGQLMKLLGLKDEQKSKTINYPKDPPRLTFVGLAFLDQWHQKKDNPTQAGTGHGPESVKTLWELHPVWKVEKF